MAMSDSWDNKSKRTFPILYLTGQTEYHGILNQDDCTEVDLWNEFLQQDSIGKLLIKVYKQAQRASIAPFDAKIEEEHLLKEIIPFRMVLHKTHRMKGSCNMSILNNNNNKNEGKDESYQSQCKYFALIWVPSNKESGLNDNEYNELIVAFKESKYFCNKLNKECIYISGPKYEPPHQTEQDHYFNIESLKNRCKKALKDDDIKKELSVEIVVHELERKQSGKRDNKKYSLDILTNDKGQSPRKSPNSRRLTYPCNNPQLTNNNSTNFGRSATDRTHLIEQQSAPSAMREYDEHEEKHELIEISMENLGRHRSTTNFSTYSNDELDAPSISTTGETHTFAFVWFKFGNEYQHQHDADGVLSALSVMYKLHKQPCGDSRDGLVNVELMGYDECYQNLNLTVDTYRSGSWKDGSVAMTLLVLLQCTFLPVFVLISPISVITFFRPKFKVTPRYRPTNEKQNEDQNPFDEFDRADPFKNLDRTEQIPYDISAIWRSFRFDKQKNNKNPSKFTKFKRIAKKIGNFILCLILNAIVYGGPVLYRGYEYDERSNGVEDLGFFDCFGPFIFYGLWTCTIIVWSCIPRGLIGPKEHLLLYYKMIAQQPKKKKKPTDDFAALTFMSPKSVMTTFNYAQRKGLLGVSSPTNELLSTGKRKIVIVFLLAVIIYFGAQNLENFEEEQQPFYVEKYNETVNQYWLRKIYGIVSNVTSWFMLCSFILLWETMIDRIKRQNNNLKNITNLIVRNTYSEYITFDHVDNLLSWVNLGDFIKRKGMMLFASLETPVFSLFLLSLMSWSGTLYCIFGGKGLEWQTENSLFSNSALATWFYLAWLSIFYMARLLWYGHKFNRESEKQEIAIRTQCRTIDNDNLLQFSKHEKLSLEQINAMKSSERLLNHLKDHSEIVPKVFGVKFDKLTAKAAWTAVISAIPTIASYIITKIKYD